MFSRRVLLAGTFIAAAAVASAQDLSIGIAGGGALTNAFETLNKNVPDQTTTYSQSKDYLLGVTLEYRLSPKFSIEADALRRELHMTEAFVEPNLVLNSVSPAPVVTWEFPILGKYRWHWNKFDPFVEAGPAFRTTGNLNANPSHNGVTAGIGVDAYWRGFGIAPAVRYTRWARDPVDHFELALSKSDQLEVLLDISRRIHVGSPTSASRLSMGLIAGTNLVSDYPATPIPTTAYQLVPTPGGPTYVQVPATAYQSGSPTFIAGLAAEIALPKRFYVEIDALHHPLCRDVRTVVSNGPTLHSSGCGVTWEVPFLAMYKFGSRRFKPILEAGPSIREPLELSKFGVTAGAGLEIRAGILRIGPSLRYTRWGPEANPSSGLIPVTRNQLLIVTTFLL